MIPGGPEGVERRHLVITVSWAVAIVVGAVLVYFLLPIDIRPRRSIVFHLIGGLAFFAAVLIYELWAIIRHPRPILRAATALALIFPLFVMVYAWTYFTMSQTSPHAFTEPLSRAGALYFAVTVLSTVGFGDIAPKTDVSRMVVTSQMILDLVLIAVVVRLVVAAARGTLGKRRTDDGDGPQD